MFLTFSRLARARKQIALLALLVIGLGYAQAQTNPAPERVFIGNAGSVNDDQSPLAAQYAARAYNAFFLEMKLWGRYEIVADLAKADWIFEISTTNHQVCHDRREQREGKPPEEDHVRINILMTDARTKDVRARLSEDVGIPRWYMSIDKLFDQTIVDLMHDLKEEVGAFAIQTPPVPHNQPMAPVPSRIGLAQKVYIHNRGVTDDPGGRYTGGNAALYDQLAAELKSWGRYQIVPASEADLVLDISFSAPSTCQLLAQPQLQLYVRDARTDTALWAFSTPVGRALRAATARKNFALDMAALVRDLREVAERPTWALNASLPAKQQEMVTAAPVSLISSSSSSTADVVPVSISLTPAVVKSGLKISATVIVKNSTKGDFNFVYPQGDPLTCVIAVQHPDGTDVKQTEEGARIIAAHTLWKGPAASYQLHPGEKQTRECAVSTLFDMSSSGTYLIKVKELDGRPAASNIATVTIVSR
ncbi:MAG TPA: hypothetical protein VFR24_11440 [Candidatus Angelobacter sp.]|nr:hypothetical protein [Candidatus Angelobacter sp.]